MNPIEFLKEILFSARSVLIGVWMTTRNLLGLPVRSYYTMIGVPETEDYAGKRRRRVTQHYPEEKWALAARFRGMPTPTVEPETGEMYCIACLACVRICPTQIIDIQWHKPGPEEPVPNDPADGKPKKKLIDKFEIDMGRCLFCALCVEACPTNPKSIVMSRDFELGSADRVGMVYEDRRLPGTHILPMVSIHGSDDQPETAYVNAAVAMAKKKGE